MNFFGWGGVELSAAGGEGRSCWPCLEGMRAGYEAAEQE